MSETIRMWIEISFNILYLIVIWSVVIIMAARRAAVDPKDRPVARRMLWMFALLALGDTGHVGFRVLAYALGGLESNPWLVGSGALSTAYTVTLFYMLLVDVWRVRFNKPLTWFGLLLLAAGLVRLVVMAFPQNLWGQIVPPYDWSLFRNVFLVVQGLGVMLLILRDAGAVNDRTFTWIGVMIAFSYAFYIPVILWSGVVPVLGMLMIPKTCAYVAVAVLGYRRLYRNASTLVTSQ